MSDLKTFLKILNKFGYPNSDIKLIAKMADYNLEGFLPDLVEELGQVKADRFTERALEKITSEQGIEIKGQYGSEEYSYIKIHNSRLDLENDETTVLCEWSWGDTNILFTDEDGNESYRTIQEIGEDLGMGDWSEYDEMVDEIKDDCSALVFNKCGFGIWFDS